MAKRRLDKAMPNWGGWDKQATRAWSEDEWLDHLEKIKEARERYTNERRLMALVRELRIATGILDPQVKKLEMVDKEDNPAAWSDGDSIYLNAHYLPESVTASKEVAEWIGAAFHELGHTLYSPRAGSTLMQRVANNIRDFPQMYKVVNIAEDMRDERLLIARFATFRGYLTAVVVGVVLGESYDSYEHAWPITCGRTWLPIKLRAMVRQAWVANFGEESARRIAEMVGKYQLLVDPAEADSAEAWVILRILHTLIYPDGRTHDQEEEIPYGSCGGHGTMNRKGTPILGDDADGNIKNADEADDDVVGVELEPLVKEPKSPRSIGIPKGIVGHSEESEDSDGDGGDGSDGQDGESNCGNSRCATCQPNSRDEDNYDEYCGNNPSEAEATGGEVCNTCYPDCEGTGDPDHRIGDEPSEPGSDYYGEDEDEAGGRESGERTPYDPYKKDSGLTHEERIAIGELFERSLDDMLKQGDVKKHIKQMQEAVSRGVNVIQGFRTKLEFERSYTPTSEQLRRRNRITTILDELRVRSLAHWERGTRMGKYVVKRTFRPMVDPSKLYDKLRPQSFFGTDIEFIILLDISGSMDENQDQLSEAAWMMHHACYAAEVTCSILAYDEGPPLPVATEDERPKESIRVIGIGGNTYPKQSLEWAQSKFNASQALAKYLIVLTDGMWSEVEECDALLALMMQDGVKTVGFYLTDEDPEELSDHIRGAMDRHNFGLSTITNSLDDMPMVLSKILKDLLEDTMSMR